MAKQGSIAPKERVNITYKPATGDAAEDVELPLKILSIGDYTGKVDERPVEERKPINIDKDNFNEVMADHDLGVQLQIDNHLSSEPDVQMALDLQFKTLKDFEPESIVAQTPELQKLLELRKALTTLKGPLGNAPAFRKKIQSLLNDDEKREQLIKELGLNAQEQKGETSPGGPSSDEPQNEDPQSDGPDSNA